jgi:hypothetical protein
MLTWRDRVPGFCITPPRLLPLLVEATITSPEAFADATTPEKKPTPPLAPMHVVAGSLRRQSILFGASEAIIIWEARMRARAKREAEAA